MQDALLKSLQTLRSDPTVVPQLYEQLATAELFAFVGAGTQSDVTGMAFLTYPTVDGIRELPLFTRRELALTLDVPEAILVSIPGKVLWPRLLDIVRTGECEAAVNPLQPHGVRLTREMVLGIAINQLPPDHSLNGRP
jgi:hypothetical protein